jgi:hypothetical protein
VVWADYSGGGLQQWIRRLRPWGKVRLKMFRKPKDSALLCVSAVTLDCKANVAWLVRWRRLEADYECLPQTMVAVIHIATIRLCCKG